MSNQLNKIDTIKVAVGVLINDQKQILIAKRPLHKPFGGLWEFPGGKIEPQESPISALNRELIEELNIYLSPSHQTLSPFHEIIYPYSDKHKTVTIHLIIYKLTEFLGQPIGAEGQEIKWVEQGDLVNYDFPLANQQIIQILSNNNNIGY